MIVLNAIRTKSACGFRDLVIGKKDRSTDQKGVVILPGDRLQFDGEPHGFFDIVANDNRTMIGEQTCAPVLQGFQREI